MRLAKFLGLKRTKRFIPIERLLGLFEPLPYHILTDEILPYLTPVSLLLNVSCVNSAFRDLAESEELWDILLRRYLLPSQFQALPFRTRAEASTESELPVLRSIDLYRESLHYWSLARPNSFWVRRKLAFSSSRMSVQATGSIDRHTVLYTAKPISPTAPSLFRIRFVNGALSASYLSLCYPDEIAPQLAPQPRRRQRRHVRELLRYHSDGSISLLEEGMVLTDRIREVSVLDRDVGRNMVHPDGTLDQVRKTMTMKVMFPLESCCILNVWIRPQEGLIKFWFGPLEEEEEADDELDLEELSQRRRRRRVRRFEDELSDVGSDLEMAFDEAMILEEEEEEEEEEGEGEEGEVVEEEIEMDDDDVDDDNDEDDVPSHERADPIDVGPASITVECPTEILQNEDRKLHFGLFVRRKQKVQVLRSVIHRGIRGRPGPKGRRLYVN